MPAATRPVVSSVRSIGYGGLAGQEHLLGLRHQRRRVDDVRVRRQVEQRRERLGLPLEPGGEGEVADQAVHQQHRRLQAVGVLEAVGDRVLDPLAHLLGGRVAVAERRRLRERLAAAQARLEQPRVPAARLSTSRPPSPSRPRRRAAPARPPRPSRRPCAARPCTGSSPGRGSRSCPRAPIATHSTSSTSAP